MLNVETALGLDRVPRRIFPRAVVADARDCVARRVLLGVAAQVARVSKPILHEQRRERPQLVGVAVVCALEEVALLPQALEHAVDALAVLVLLGIGLVFPVVLPDALEQLRRRHERVRSVFLCGRLRLGQRLQGLRQLADLHVLAFVVVPLGRHVVAAPVVVLDRAVAHVRRRAKRRAHDEHVEHVLVLRLRHERGRVGLEAVVRDVQKLAQAQVGRFARRQSAAVGQPPVLIALAGLLGKVDAEPKVGLCCEPHREPAGEDERRAGRGGAVQQQRLVRVGFQSADAGLFQALLRVGLLRQDARARLDLGFEEAHLGAVRVEARREARLDALQRAGDRLRRAAELRGGAALRGPLGVRAIEFEEPVFGQRHVRHSACERAVHLIHGLFQLRVVVERADLRGVAENLSRLSRYRCLRVGTRSSSPRSLR